MGGGTSKSSSSQSRSAVANKPIVNNVNKFAIKVPLHVALRAIVLIQKRFRIKLARWLLIRLIEEKRIQDGAALKFLLDLQEQIHDQKVSPSKQATNKFSNIIALFNGNDVIETVDGAKIDIEDYHAGNRLTHSTTLINPTIGFVVKSKTTDNGRKVFINICHHEMLLGSTVKFSSPRLLSNTVSDNGVFDLNFENTLVFDVVISSSEYLDNFQYKQGIGIVPKHSKVKNKFSEMAISFLNSFEHSYSTATPHSASHSPTKGKGKKQASSDSESSDFKISTAYKIPKIRRGYVGELLPLVFDLHSVHMMHSFCKPVDRPVKGAKKPKASSIANSLSLPPLVRSWVSLPAVAPLEGADGSDVTNMLTRGSFSMTRSGSDLGTRYSEPTVEDRYTGSVASASVTLTAGNTKRSMNDLSDDEEEGVLDDSQKEYFKRLNALQSGLAAYLTLNHGCLTLYNSLNLMSVPAQNKPRSSLPDGKQNDLRINTAPYGRDEFMRLLLCDYQVSTLIDQSNNIFYVQLLPSGADSVTAQDRLLGMLCNRYPAGGDRADSELTIQCKSHSEMLTWKLLFTAHIEYAQHRLSQLQTLPQSPLAPTINGTDLAEQPARYSSWLVRKVSNPAQTVPGMLRSVTQRVFGVAAMGVLNLYGSDASEDSLIESIPLNGRVVDMRRGALDARTNTLDVVIALRLAVPQADDEAQEFLYNITPDAEDEHLATLDALQRHITFAGCYAGAYLLPILEFNHRVSLAPAAVAPVTPPTAAGGVEATPTPLSIRRGVSLGVVTMESAYKEYVPPKKEEVAVVVEVEEEEVNSDDDEEDEEEEEMKRKAAAELLRRQEPKPKPFSGVRENVFRCVGGTRDYNAKTDLNIFAADRNAPLTPNNSFDLVLVDNRLCVYKALCHIASVNLVSQENVECVTAVESAAAEISAALPIATNFDTFNSPKKNKSDTNSSNINSNRKGGVEESKGDDKTESAKVYSAWQIVVIATNSLKYRLGFRTEEEYFQWLRVIDGRSQCPENKVLIAPPTSGKKKKKTSKHHHHRRHHNQRSSPGSASVSEMSAHDSDSGDEDDSDGEGDERESVSPLGASPKGRKTLNETGDSKVEDSSDKEDGEAGDAELVRAHGNSKTASTLASFQNKLNIKGTNPVDATSNNLDNNATKKYSRLMRAKESVVASGVVLKHEAPKKSGAFSPAGAGTRRMLLLTDLPRLIFIDPVSNIIRGHIELSKNARIEYKSTSAADFEITVTGVTTKFTASDGPAKDAKFWVYKLKVAIGK